MFERAHISVFLGTAVIAAISVWSFLALGLKLSRNEMLLGEGLCGTLVFALCYFGARVRHTS